MLNKMLQRPFFYDMVVDGNVIYFPMAVYNALCKGNLENDHVEIIDIFPEIDIFKFCAYMGIYRYKNYLIMSPSSYNDKKDYLIYDIEKSKYIKLENSRKHVFFGYSVFRNNDKLYIVSMETTEVDIIDLQKLSIESMSCKEYVTDDAQAYHLERVENSVYMPLNKRKVVLIFDMDKEEFRHIDFPKNISHIQTICYYNKKFWITGNSNRIYAWEQNEENAEEIADFSSVVQLFHQTSEYFESSFIYSDVLWLFPGHAESILKFNILTKQFEKFEIEGEEESAEQLDNELKNGRCFSSKYASVQRVNNKVFFISSKTRIFYELDLTTNNISKHDFKVDSIYNGCVYPPGIEGVMYENWYTNGLQSLLRMLNKNNENIEIKNEKIVGKAINDCINSTIL